MPSAQPINVFNEGPLHAALKEWYAQPGDLFEHPVDDFIIDIVRGDRLVEIQTGNFAALRRKLRQLLPTYRIHLVFPVPAEKWICKVHANGTRTRRKSPKRGTYEEVFRELVRIPRLLAHPHLSLEVVIINEEEVRRREIGRAWRRRGWVTQERRLLTISESRVFNSPTDLVDLLPSDLPTQFTTADIASRLAITRSIAQKMAYCLRKLEMVRQVGKRQNAYVYERSA